MKNKYNENEKLPPLLENLELPQLQMPVHQEHLRKVLLASGCFKKEDSFLSRWNNKFKPKAWVFAASFAVLLVALGSYLTYFTAPQAVANLMMQVNPALTMTLSARNTILGAEGLDEQGKSLLVNLDLTGKTVQEALRIIVGALHESGLLENERRISIALHPVGDRLGEAELSALTDTVSKQLDSYLTEQNLPVKVTNIVLSENLAAAVSSAGLLPGDYTELVAVLGSAAAVQLLNLQQELGLDQTLFREKFDTISDSLIELTQAGMTAEAALVVLKTTLALDPKLERLTAITEAVIDLMQEGLSKEEALAAIQAAIKSDPTLRELDDLPEAPESEEDDEPGSHLPDKPQQDVPETGTIEEEIGEDDEAGRPESDKPEDDTAAEDDTAEEAEEEN